MRETRTLSLEADVRATDDTAELHFTGHAAVFDQRTWIGPKRWGFWEVVDRGFFRNVLNDDAAFLVNHDPNIVLARNGNTMSLSVDDTGLVVDARFSPDDAEARLWSARVKRGDVTKMSFAFTVAEEEWSDDGDDELRSLLTAERLFDTSLVTYPAYEGTDAGMRSIREVVKRHRGVDPDDALPAPRRPYESDRDRLQRRYRFLASRYRLAR
jgi:hypothetical protein